MREPLGLEDGLLMTPARRVPPARTGDEAAHVAHADERTMEHESQLRMGPVVVGYDGSDAARRGLLRAALLAAGRGSLVVVAVSQPSIRSPAGETLVEASSQDETQALLEEASSLLGGRDAEFSTRAEEGAPAEVLARVARETDASLIVVGVRGHSFVTRALVGSVAADLVERAPCDVLVAR